VSLSEPLRSRAIALFKDGTDPAAVFHDLVRGGADQADADACVRELLALKAAAAAQDPTRLRDHATWMLVNGASRQDVIRFDRLPTETSSGSMGAPEPAFPKAAARHTSDLAGGNDGRSAPRQGAVGQNHVVRGPDLFLRPTERHYAQ